MGQYGNQPDFGTRTLMISPAGDAYYKTGSPFLNSAALYVGTTGDLLVTVAGNNDIASEFNGATLFKNVSVGFFPVIVNYVWSLYDGSGKTTCSDIVAIY